MPRGRSTFNKRQKEQARQQKQRDKAMRRAERKDMKPEGTMDDLSELHQHAAAQAALFQVGEEEDNVSGSSENGLEENY